MNKTAIPSLCTFFLMFIVPLSGSNLEASDGLEFMRATFRMTDGGVSGTAWIVQLPKEQNNEAKIILVSAAHVFHDIKGDKGTLVFRKPAGEKIVRDNFSVVLRKDGKKLWTQHPSLDIAAMEIELPEGIDILPIRYEQLADEKFVSEAKLSVGQNCFVPCFPAKLESSPAGWPVLRSGSIASHPLTPASEFKTFLLDYSSFGGDSGAPVIVPASKKTGTSFTVVALITGQHRQTDKTTSPFEERVVHTSLGLGICIQSCFIRETIEALKDE